MDSVRKRRLAGPLLLGLFFSFMPRVSLGAALGPEFMDLSTLPLVSVDLRYASKNNFMNEDLYGDFRTAYLHEVAFKKFKAAGVELEKRKPGWKFLVFDALRPRSVQRRLWEKVKGTDQEEYVANPEPGSIHNFGFAIDISLMDEHGKEVDMGTEFDNFTELAQPVLEDRLLKQGKLTRVQVANRKILRAALEKAGFKNIRNEWWHFDALPPKEVREKFKIVE